MCGKHAQIGGNPQDTTMCGKHAQMGGNYERDDMVRDTGSFAGD